MTDPVTIFRALHDGPDVLLLANAWDAGSARLAQSLGAPAVATTSAGVAWSLGYPDDRSLPVDLAIGTARGIARVLDVPLSIDLEHGYSDDPDVVAGHVAQLVEAGVAGINIEDGTDDPSVLAGKIEAIRRAGGDIFINARTDVYLRGLAPEDARVWEVLQRAKLYRDAGADGLFVPGICAPDEIRVVVDSVELPVNVLAWGGLPSVPQLAALGVRRLSAGSSIAADVWGTTRGLMQAFLAGTDAPATHEPMDYGQMQQLFAP